jgi:hypothetical protein
MEDVVQFVDQDGDGQIEYHEFAKVFHKLVPMSRHADAAIPEFDAKAKTDMLHYLEKIQLASRMNREKKVMDDMRKLSEQDEKQLYSNIDTFIDKNSKVWARGGSEQERGWLSKDFSNSGIPCVIQKPKTSMLPSIAVESKTNMSLHAIGIGGFANVFGNKH